MLSWSLRTFSLLWSYCTLLIPWSDPTYTPCWKITAFHAPPDTFFVNFVRLSCFDRGSLPWKRSLMNSITFACPTSQMVFQAQIFERPAGQLQYSGFIYILWKDSKIFFLTVVFYRMRDLMSAIDNSQQSEGNKELRELTNDDMLKAICKMKESKVHCGVGQQRLHQSDVD